MPACELTVGDRVFTVYDDGAPDGRAIVFHHGTPAAGGPFEPWVTDARERGARLIGYDRPGYSDSTPDPGRTVGDAARDTAAILDALGIERFVTWGISGGGPHALACAALLPERVDAVALLGSVAPFDADGLNYFRAMGADNLVEFGLAMGGRHHIAPFLEREAGHMVAASPEELVAGIATLVEGPDQAVLADGGFGRHWAATMQITFAHGPAGWIDDDLAFVAPFGFDVGAVSVPALVVHGRQDRFVPSAHGEWLAAAIPDAEAWLEPEEAHLTLLERRIPDVHAWLLGH